MSSQDCILITGATSGLGRQIAISLSKNYKLVLVGRDDKKLEAVKKECSKTNLVSLLNIDLNNTEAIEMLLSDYLKEKDLNITKFIHCAGVSKMIPCRSFSVDDFEYIFNTNIVSAGIITKVLVSKKYNGVALDNIVFISSNISTRGAKAMGIYAASKSALDGLMRSLSIELAPRIRVNSVLPGAMVTPMTEQIYADSDYFDSIQKKYPMGIGRTNQLVPVIEFLISDDANWINLNFQ